eukprot:7377867-Prymnesium_polylepis.1
MWDDPVLDEHLDLGQYEPITSTNAAPEIIIRVCRRPPNCRPPGGSLPPCARGSCRSGAICPQRSTPTCLAGRPARPCHATRTA